MGSSPTYLIMMVMVPIACTIFFLSLLSEGLPLRVPTALVDLDQSELSRTMGRQLNSNELIDMQYKLESYHEAMDYVRSGKVYGFFVIPSNFQEDAIAGRTPTVCYYTNLTYFVPGTLSFKGFKTISVTTAGGVITSKLSSMGVPTGEIKAMVQPVAISSHGIGNPWTNYSYYLSPSFTLATLALIIMIMTAYSITIEIKKGTSPQWLQTADNNIYVAMLGKMLPHSVVFIAVAMCIMSMLFGYRHFPMHGHLGALLWATVIFVLANQSFAAMVTCLLPNPRMALSAISLLGILTFSFAGFSFPVEKMYGAIAIFSYMMPVRYLFLIYVNTALNGFDIYYVRYYYVALLGFLFLWMIFARNLKKACLNPVYVP